MHLGPAARQIAGEAARQSAQGLVSEPRRGHRGRRFRCDLSPAKATAGDHRAARVGLCASLPLPRVTARHAPESDRHWPVQIRRVQAERAYQSGTQFGLLEKWKALPRRDRIYCDPESVDCDPLIYRRQVRHDIPVRGDGASTERCQEPSAASDLRAGPANAHANLIINRDAPPFDDPQMRRALALALDRKAFIDILTEGQGDVGGAMQPPPEGVWGLPPDMLKNLPGYDPDVQKSRAEARGIMEKLGFGSDNRLEVKVSERNIPIFLDPAVILIDQLKEIYIDGELDPIETANWFPKIYRKDYTIGLNLTGVGADDPDAQFYENYACGSQRNYTGYCNPDLQKLFDQQSMEADQEKRRRLVWEIDRRLQEDQARPIVYHLRFATCWQPRVKGLRMMVNSVFNGWRFEDVWLDK